MAQTFCPSSEWTFCGTSMDVSLPCPNLPHSPKPKLKSPPSDEIASECESPALTCAIFTLRSASTRAG
eukprot:scaffold9953_cov32-Tisochrysis_lutea.AAC.2